MPSTPPTSTATCRSCNARIIWVVSGATGKRFPVDADPVPNGNLRLDAQAGGGFVAHVRTDQLQLGTADSTTGDRYIAHHATCPDGAEWRGKGRRRAR